MKRITPIPLLLLSLAFTSCVGVTRVPERVHTPQGSGKKIDLSFIQPGNTSRTEVAEKLKLVDTGFQSDHFFLGRWTDSKWGGWALVAGDNSATGGAKRFWHNVNLLVEFDDKGTVKRYEAFPDRLLIEKLAPVVAESSIRPEQRRDIHIPFIKFGFVGVPFGAKLVLSADSLEFADIKGGKKVSPFSVPAAELIDVSHSPVYSDSDPVHPSEILHFSRDLKQSGGPHGKKLYVQVSLPDLVVLLNYLSQHRPARPNTATDARNHHSEFSPATRLSDPKTDPSRFDGSAK